MGVGDKVEKWIGMFDVPGYLDAHPHMMLFLVTVIASLCAAVLTAIVAVNILLRSMRRQASEYPVAASAVGDRVEPRPTFVDHASITDPDEIAPYPTSLSSEPVEATADAVR